MKSTNSMGLLPETLKDDTVSIELLELHPQEVQLLRMLRGRFKFGDVTIRMRDGLPFRLVRIQEFGDLVDS